MASARFLLCAAPLAAPAWAQPRPGMDFSHHDWQLVCDNTRTCRAAGYAPDDGQDGAIVLLTRAAGPMQPVAGELQVGGDAPASADDLHLLIDDRDLGALAGSDTQGRHPLSARHLAALLAALVRDSDIQVADRTGRRWALSDQGAAAVLLKMDEYQGRLQTPGALVRKGARAETSVLAALPLPVVVVVVVAATVLPTRADDIALGRSATLRAALRTTLDTDPGECDRFDTTADQPLQVERLDAHRLLVAAPCWMGAYNSGDAYWVVNHRPPFAPRLVTYDGTGHDAGQIIASQKGRGIGDCRGYSSWHWNGEGFVPTSSYQTGLCCGEPGGFWELPRLVTDLRSGG
jgi:hypothetical protein